MGTFGLIGLVGGAALIVVGVGMARAMNKEKAAGYTTLFDASKANVWQLNPRTGEVVRTPRASDAR